MTNAELKAQCEAAANTIWRSPSARKNLVFFYKSRKFTDAELERSLKVLQEQKLWDTERLQGMVKDMIQARGKDRAKAKEWAKELKRDMAERHGCTVPIDECMRALG